MEESNKSNIKFPAASLIKYQDVKNIINKVSRKHPDEQLKEREEARLVELTGAYNNLKKTVIEEMDLPVFQDIEDRKKKIADIESLIHNMKGFINTLEKARNTTAQAEPSGQS